MDQAGPTLPTPEIAQDAIVGGLAPVADPARIGCVARTGAVRLRHYRADGIDGVVDSLQVHQPADVDRREMVELGVYAGPLLEHFGHLVSECIHRLWAVGANPELSQATILFQAHPGHGFDRQPWFREVLALCGIDRRRIRIVTDQLLVRRLVIPRQGRVLGGDILIPGYVSLFPLVPLPAAPAGEMLYVSRARQLHGGNYLGETLVERILAEAGFAIVHPEELSVTALVSRLASARLAVFAEGSAIHNLELCGRTGCRVLVIGRRPGTRRRFGAILGSLVKDWRIVPAGDAAISFDWDAAAGRLRGNRGCSVPDLPRLVERMADFLGLNLPVPSAAAARAAQREDLLRYLLDRRSGGDAGDAAIGHALRRIREQAASDGLI